MIKLSAHRTDDFILSVRNVHVLCNSYPCDWRINMKTKPKC